MEYFAHIAIIVIIYVMLAEALNLLLGYTGILSLAQAALFGAGAYVFGIAIARLQLSLTLGFAGVATIAIVAGYLVSSPLSRFKGDLLAIGTFALQVILYNLFNNLLSITGGPNGISGIQGLNLFGIEVETTGRFLVFCVLVYAITHLLYLRTISSSFGRTLKAIREDELLVQVLGRSHVFYIIVVFMVSTLISFLAGAVYAAHIGFIDPSSFTIMESINIISLVVIGGLGTKWGPAIGVLILIVLQESLRFVGLSGAIAGNIRQVIFSAVIIAFLMFRSEGVIGINKYYYNDR